MCMYTYVCIYIICIYMYKLTKGARGSAEVKGGCRRVAGDLRFGCHSWLSGYGESLWIVRVCSELYEDAKGKGKPREAPRLVSDLHFFIP